VSNYLVNLPTADAYAIAGKYFSGWKSNYDGKIYPAGLQYRIPRWLPSDLTLTFTAVWKDAGILIDLDPNGAQKTWSDSAGKRSIDTVLTLPILSRYGYEFEGWYDRATNTKIPEKDGRQRVTVLEKEQRLFAMWKPLKIEQVSIPDPPYPGYYYLDRDQAQGKGHTGKGYSFGDTVTFFRYDGIRYDESNINEHIGWKFAAGSTGKYKVYEFDAPFVNKIQIVIDENFAKGHANSADQRVFFNRQETIVAAPIVIQS
jgi:uncharacterized repeat protein (TIGR02543 family)